MYKDLLSSFQIVLRHGGILVSKPVETVKHVLWYWPGGEASVFLKTEGGEVGDK